jgi:hypothetical protein
LATVGGDGGVHVRGRGGDGGLRPGVRRRGVHRDKGLHRDKGHHGREHDLDDDIDDNVDHDAADHRGPDDDRAADDRPTAPYGPAKDVTASTGALAGDGRRAGGLPPLLRPVRPDHQRRRLHGR